MKSPIESEQACTTRAAPSIVGAIVVASCLAGTVCHAQDSESPFDLHAYGQISELKNAEVPVAGWENDYDVSLLGVWRMHPDFKAWLQIAHYSEMRRTRVEWAFLDWTLSGSTTLRLGQARLPMGMLNESRDVQALRNSIGLPLMYGHERPLVDEAFRGAVLEQRSGSSNGGELITEYYASGAMIADEGQGIGSRIVGGRVHWTPPSSAWSFAASAYAGQQSMADADARAWRARSAAVGSAKWHAPEWDVIGEIGVGRFGANSNRAGYLQCDHLLAPQWAMFVRADFMRQHDAAEGPPSRRERLSTGLAWRPSLNWGLRFEAGSNHAPTATPLSTAARPSWNDFALSVNFNR
jgi:hypothetical protein